MKMLLGRITCHNLFQAFRSVYLLEEKMQLEESEKGTRKYELGFEHLQSYGEEQEEKMAVCPPLLVPSSTLEYLHDHSE